MSGQNPELKRWLSEKLFNAAPVHIAVIDRDFNLVHANHSFETTFGAWRNRKCYEVYKDRDSVCSRCFAAPTFDDGIPRVGHETGVNDDGRVTHYLKHTIPVRLSSGEVSYLVEISTDVTAMERLKQENELFFDRVPCDMAILDRNMRIVRANQQIIEKFGHTEGRRCFEVLANHDRRCDDCPAHRTLADGNIHTGHSKLIDASGNPVYLQVTTMPVSFEEDEPTHVLEMAVDITRPTLLQEELKIAHLFLETTVATSMDAVVTMNEKRDITIMNPAAKRLFRLADGEILEGHKVAAMLPDGFFDEILKRDKHVYLPDTFLKLPDMEPIPVRLVGAKLIHEGRLLGVGMFIQDQRRLKQLESEKLEAERLAAVGQTVAGLAHGVKNLITGLEGGMYMMSTGLKKDNRKRIERGWSMLDRNIARVSKFVKDFLSFAKGRSITAAPCDPASVAKEVVDLYAAKAHNEKIELRLNVKDEIFEANLDYEGMHECLTNLVGNAIDACLMSECNHQLIVTVEVEDGPDVLLFRVSDNGCGMDYEVKQKVFTTFFTTKGLGGTGLGLLMTRKIVQEHGGTIELDSEPGVGTTFTIRLPRARLPKVAQESDPPCAGLET